jgi:glycosyltransferase involved in cell wall biosynthesis
MRDLLRETSVTAVVFVSTTLGMSLGFAIGLAPVQIWWSMKYHSLEFPEIDGYMANGSFESTRLIGKRSWRSVHGAYGPLYDPGLAERASTIRAELGVAAGQIVLGCIGREEKVSSPRYIAALGAILRRLPNAIYIWTGRTKSADICDMFDANGIEERCLFVGWIDSRVYAQALDVFVDSFPFASGLTAFEAMAASVPVVAMVTSEALETGWPAHIWPLVCRRAGTQEDQDIALRILDDGNGGSLLPCVATEADFVERTVRLASDPEYRHRTGAAVKALVERFMRDELRMGQSGCFHILQIIEEKRNALYPRGRVPNGVGTHLPGDQRRLIGC